MIRFNVGGVGHTTTKATIERHGPHMLRQMVEHAEAMSIPLEFFIDRNGELFGYVLDFLRCGALPVNDDVLHRLAYEADFYCLSDMQAALRGSKGCVEQVHAQLDRLMKR